jgi:hypothetical protein
MRAETQNVQGRDVAALQSAMATAMVGNHTVILPDYADGHRFEHTFTDAEFRSLVGPVAARLKELCESVVINEDEMNAIRYVQCIGGGTRLHEFEEAVRAAFPNAEFNQANPDEIVTVGASLDVAQVTNRLPAGLSTRVISVVPHSIGTLVVGGVMSFMIRRGEPLPAVAFTTLVTTIDNQENATIRIYQGEHLLAERNNRIGAAEITGLPPRPRGKCKLCCRIEYNENGILQFSGEEPSTGKSVNATFIAKSEFTEEDQMRMHEDRKITREEEVRLARIQHVRTKLELDIRHATGQSQSPEVNDVATKWAEWLKAHPRGDIGMFHAKWREALREFYQLNPSGWENPATIRPFIQFTPIWPVEPTFVAEGSAIVHFMVDGKFSDVYANVIDMTTDSVITAKDICQIAGQHGMVETFIRVAFPENGKYAVTTFAGVSQSARHFGLLEAGEDWYEWKFDVEGAPSPNRPLPSLLAGRISGKLRPPEGFELQPLDWCVKLKGREYKFSCKYRGASLKVNGREQEGEPEQLFFANITPPPRSNPDAGAEGVITCPGEGIWRLLFFVDKHLVVTQFLMTGSAHSLGLKPEEKAALNGRSQ